MQPESIRLHQGDEIDTSDSDFDPFSPKERRPCSSKRKSMSANGRVDVDDEEDIEVDVCEFCSG